jgi:hypothetical protein
LRSETCDFPLVTSRQTKYGQEKKFEKLFQQTPGTKDFARALLALWSRLLRSGIKDMGVPWLVTQGAMCFFARA